MNPPPDGRSGTKGKKGKPRRKRKAKQELPPPPPGRDINIPPPEPAPVAGPPAVDPTSAKVDAMSATEVSAALAEMGLPSKGKVSLLRHKLKKALGAPQVEVKPRIEAADDPTFLEQERLRATINLLISRGRPDLADDLIERLDPQIVGEVEVRLPAGIAKHMAGELQQAEDTFLAALEVDGDDIRILENLEQLTFETHRFRESKRYIERLIANDPRKAEYWARRAIIHASERNFDLALQSAEKSLDRDPDNPEYLNLTGAYALMVGRHETAREAFARALELDGGFTTARRNLAIICSILGDHDRAQAVAEDLDDLTFATLATRARIKARAGDAEGALTMLDDSSLEEPGIPILKAEILVASGDPDAALPILKDLVAATDLEEAREGLARAYASKGWFQEAITVLKELPEPPETWISQLQDLENARELGERQGLEIPEDDDGRHRCPRCHSTLRKGADICKSCGYLMGIDEDAYACPTCGEDLPGPDAPCPNCSQLDTDEVAESRLREIRGVGASLAHRLLEAFGDLDGIAKAKPAQLAAIKGVTKKLAGRIRKELKD